MSASDPKQTLPDRLRESAPDLANTPHRAGALAGARCSDAVPDEQHDDGAQGRGDESSALVSLVPADCLADECRQEGAGDAQRRGQEDAGRLLGRRREQARDDAGHEADQNDPEEAQVRLLRVTRSGSFRRRSAGDRRA